MPELSGGFLLGEQPHLSDFARASQLIYLGGAPATREALQDRPRTRAFLERLPQTRG